MPTVVVAPRAAEDLERIITSNELPADARSRVRSLLAPLAEFPRMGSPLGGRWEGFRYLLGPWPWMLLLYVFDEEQDLVAVTTIQDARMRDAATSAGEPRCS